MKALRLRRSERAFTLVEVVIAVSILALIMSIAYGSITAIIRSKKALDDGRDASVVANAVLSRLTRELQLAIGQSALINVKANDGSTLAGVSFFAESTKVGDAEGDSLQFLALEGGQYLPDGGTHSGIVQIHYHVEKNEGTEQSGENQTYALVRDEIPYTRPFNTAMQKTMTFPITKDLVSLALSYYDGRDKQWVSEWGEGAHTKLPSMVKLQLKLRSPAGRVSVYSTVVALRATT